MARRPARIPPLPPVELTASEQAAADAFEAAEHASLAVYEAAVDEARRVRDASRARAHVAFRDALGRRP